jgi:single-strand DNA-binding protein
MATIKNSVRLIGNVGMDPDVRTFDNNRKMVRLSIATNDSYKNDKGEKVTDTQWHNIVLWGAQATMAETYLKKGRLGYY